MTKEVSEQEDKETKSNAIFAEVISWIKTVVFAVVFALIINNLVIVHATVPTSSMENSIMANDRIVAFRLSYLLEEPERFDVVVFRFPDDEKVLYVKRLIGMPGETIEIRGGKVYIDGSETPLEDWYTKEEPRVEDFGPYTVPEGHYFMLGDNRNHSADSRYWNHTYLSKEKMLGKVIFKYYPSFKIYDNEEITNYE